MLSLPQTHVLFASNVIIRSCKRYHPLLQTLSSAPSNVIIRPCKRYHPLLQTLSSAPANVCLRFWLFLPRDDERYGLPLAPRISSMIRLFVWGRRKDVCNISFAGGSAARSRVSFVVSKICINGKVAVTLYHIIYIRKNIYGYTATVSQCDGRVQKPVCQETA